MRFFVVKEGNRLRILEESIRDFMKMENDLYSMKLERHRNLKHRVEEQQAIADILSTIDQKIEHHTTKKQKLEELFRSLLHELMTARVRVNEVELKEVIK